MNYPGPPSLIPFRQDQLWGYCDPHPQVIIPAQFDGVEPFIGDFAIFWDLKAPMTGDNGLIDRQGNIVVPPECVWITLSATGPGMLMRGEKVYRRSLTGELYTPTRYEMNRNFDDELIIAETRVDDQLKRGVIDRDENIVIPFDFLKMEELDEKGYAFAKSPTGRTGFITRQGEWIFSFEKGELEVYSWFQEDLASLYRRVDSQRFTGAVDRHGQIVIPPIYERLHDCSEGVMAAVDRHGAGFIDLQGNVVIPFVYEHTGSFTDGLGTWAKKGRRGLLDHAGNEVLRLEVDDIRVISRDLIIVGKRVGPLKTHYGIIDSTGRELLPIRFETIRKPEDGFFFVYDGQDTWYLDMQLRSYHPQHP